MFHLFTHAFFKAMLFLGAGSVIHGMHHEQDMRNYGGLRHKLPYTFWAMMIGTLAITGVGIPVAIFSLGELPIGFAGFLSKDAIIESAFAAGTGASAYAFWLLVVAALFTSFYSWRLMFLTFYGTPRGDKHTHAHAHESPTVMLIPLGVLALGAIFSGMLWFSSFFGHTDQVAKWYGIPYAEAGAHSDEAHGDDHADDGHGEAKAEDDGHGGEAKHHYVLTGVPGEGAIYMAPDNTVMEDAHKVPYWVKTSPFIAMVLGFATAWLFYVKVPSLPGAFARNLWPLYNFLLNKWYFDEIYNFLVVGPAKWLGGFLWKRGDGNVIDGGINGLAMGIIPFITRLAGRAQSGYIFHYAFAMVIGITILITWAVLSQAGVQ